ALGLFFACQRPLSTSAQAVILGLGPCVSISSSSNCHGALPASSSPAAPLSSGHTRTNSVFLTQTTCLVSPLTLPAMALCLTCHRRPPRRCLPATHAQTLSF
ncbi:hypothetical protein DFH09DRAFT_1223557, partial [Mycena vulgaris]